ncbi:MAG: hypothetical protein ACRCSP_06275 [Rhodoglobus sp.]
MTIPIMSGTGTPVFTQSGRRPRRVLSHDVGGLITFPAARVESKEGDVVCAVIEKSHRPDFRQAGP